MAIKLEANYSKKIGLPGYSSHQFSVSLTTEINDLSQVESESARLYQQLQHGVDTSIQEIGWLPQSPSAKSNGHANGNGHSNGNGNGNGNGYSRQSKDEMWLCTPKQKDLILKIVTENNLDKNEVEQLALDRFSKSVKKLNTMQASGLIKELLEKYPSNNGRSNQPQQPSSRR